MGPKRCPARTRRANVPPINGGLKILPHKNLFMNWWLWDFFAGDDHFCEVYRMNHCDSTSITSSLYIFPQLQFVGICHDASRRLLQM